MTRRRARITNRGKAGSTGGGGGPGAGGTINWGPNFGEQSELDANAAALLATLGLSGGVASAGAVDLSAVDPRYVANAASGAVDLSAVDLSGNVTISGNITGTLAPDYALISASPSVESQGDVSGVDSSASGADIAWDLQPDAAASVTKFGTGAQFTEAGDESGVCSSFGTVAGDYTLFIRYNCTDTGSVETIFEMLTSSLSSRVRLQNSGASDLRLFHATHSPTTETLTGANGDHALWIQRDDTAKTLIAHLDGVEILNTTYTGSTSADRARFGNTGGIDCDVYEVRLWDALVSTSELDRLSDENDSQHEGQSITVDAPSEPAEIGFWRFNVDRKRFAFDPSYSLHAASGAADLAAVDLSGNTGCSGAVEDFEVLLESYIAAQDSWVATDTGCLLDNTNHDGEDLQCQGGASPKEIYMKWDLSGLPSNATVISASITMTLKTPPIGTNSEWILGLTSTAGASWDESTITCSNRPARGSDAASVRLTWLTTDSPGREDGTSLNSTGISRLEERMGVGDFNLIWYVNSVAAANAVVESKDEGTNDSLGPRLEIRFTVPK